MATPVWVLRDGPSRVVLNRVVRPVRRGRQHGEQVSIETTHA